MQLIDEGSLVLRAAVQNELVDTVLTPFDGASIPLSMFALVTDPKFRRLHPDPDDPELFELSPSAQSLRHQESFLGMVTHQVISDHVAAEVARFAVPKGEIGFIRAVEQIVNDVQGDFFPTNQEYWGSPEFAIPEVDNIRWFLKLDYYNGVLPPVFYLTSTVPFTAASLPGYPYLDLPQINALFYPAHNNRRIKLIVPGNRILRMFVYGPPTELYQWRYGGRLAGSVQSTYNQQAKLNARALTC